MDNWLVISTEKQAENEILRAKIESLELVLKRIAHDGIELSQEKIRNQRDYFIKLAHQELYGKK
jgi:hypothetical protein